MIHIAICDDLSSQVEKTKTATEQYFGKHKEESILISTFDNPMLFLESLDKNGCYDIVLLDICMPGMLGTDVAREIRNRHDKTEIIFLTTSDEFAVDAFILKAAHYLVKPFTQDLFDEAMQRAMERFSADTPKQLVLKTEGGEIRTVEINEIQYIESCAHGQTLHMNGGSLVESRRSLARLLEELEELSPEQFIAPYKGYLVNQRAIDTIDSKRILLRCGAVIPIPRGSFRELQLRYFSYLFGGNPQKSGVSL